MRPGGCMNKFICDNEDYTMYHTQMNQTAERMIRDIEAGRTTMDTVCAEWNNLCYENGRDDLIIMAPTRRYKLVNKLRGKQWMVNYGDERTNDDGDDPREWCGNDIQAAHAEALDMNEWYGFTEEQRDVQNKRVVYGINLMHKMDADSAVEACHAEALVLNEMVDDAVVFGTTTNENAWPNARNDAVAKIRDDLINYYGTVEPRFIIKMMISVRRLAREATDAKIAWWNEVMQRPSSPDAGSEIPF